MTYKCFMTAKHQQALLVIMCISMSLTVVNPHRGDYCNYQQSSFITSLFPTLYDFLLLNGLRIDEKYLHHSNNNHHHHHSNNHHQHHKSHHNSLASSSEADDAETSMSTYGSSFETMNNTHIIAQLGSTAILPCIVETSATQATVNWIRRSDYKLLTG